MLTVRSLPYVGGGGLSGGVSVQEGLCQGEPLPPVDSL